MKSLTLISIFLALPILAFCQEVDSLLFEHHLTVLDSLRAYKSEENCINYIDSLVASQPFSKYQQSYLNIMKGRQLALEGKDSLASIIIENESKYLRLIGDTTALSYSNILEVQGFLNLSLKEYEKALEYFEQSKIIRKFLLGEEHLDYAACLFSSAIVYSEMGQYNNAETLYIQNLEIKKKVLGEKNSQYTSTLNNLGNLYQSMGQYEKAEPLLIQTLNTRKEIFGTDHLSYSKSLFNLAGLYRDMGQYEKAEPLLIQAKNNIKIILDEKHPDYATTIKGLAKLYLQMGQYEKAEPLLAQAINISKEVLGEKSIDYATSLNAMAFLYVEMGLFEKAEPLYIKELNIKKDVLGEKNTDYAIALFGLAVVYHKLNQHEKAEPLYIQSKDIFREVLGKNHPYYAYVLANLASLYNSMNQHEKAEPLLIQALDIKKETLGTIHPSYANGLNLLASVYYDLGQYEKAEPLLVQSLNIRKEVLSEKHPNYATSLFNLGRVTEKLGNYEETAELIIMANNIYKKLLSSAFDLLSENEKMVFHERMIHSIDFLKELGLNYASTELNEEIFSTLLFEKGLHLNSDVQTKAFIQSQGDSRIIQTYQNLASNKKKLYDEYQKPKAKQSNLDSLENSIGILEKKMAKASAGFRREQKFHEINHKQIADKLEEGEVAIEFTHFISNNTIMYAAAILSADENIDFIPLVNQKLIFEKLKLHEEDNTTFINALYGSNERGLVKEEKELPSLYDLIWKPIEPYLKAANKIYYSPSGIINRLNVNAIAIDQETILADKYNMVELMSTRTVALEHKMNNNNTAFTIGGIDFETEDNLAAAELGSEGTGKDQITFSSIDRSLRGGSWNYLKWTKTETESINVLLQDHGFNVTYKSESQATEAAFKSLGTKTPSPQILHLATHGYFFPDTEDNDSKKNTFESSKHPLLRSGLILSGGNKAWQGEETAAGSEDGILTAYEISNMNLTNTELVVLSACETGLGDIQGSEGVYGLQRAFKMAGAKYLIMSLWQVPDRATSVFMKTFYEKYLEDKMNIRDAFNKTQLEMRDRLLDPYAWAGFVLIE